ncbi:DUF2441 domain-containing protein [Vibrio lentus]|uniref:DUF2441 domain-containing protein n=1 Tax=Vibrio lentus TaxID=136468 RepID=UPI000CAF3282|nr:DUF2441 domain-containing protein [Vibrio lentus]PMJ83371.1 hypothetical protein BCU14_14250 [Vibrio lentus]PMN34729.1 hypothetical protein BCT33_12575 [Vibrio lentus]PMN57236.1 hypothetical protein BCT29_10670 [Vibrio lentus]
MITFYTVDRSGELNEGLELALQTEFGHIQFQEIENLCTRDDMLQRVIQLYPNGISRHGIYYLLTYNLLVHDNQTGQPLSLAPHIPVMEGIFELVRKQEFPERPSRMQSVFAWCTEDEAMTYRALNGNEVSIYEIESDEAFIADQNLLYLGTSIAGATEFARKYWSGERSNNFKPEAIIPLPTLVGRKVI